MSRVVISDDETEDEDEPSVGAIARGEHNDDVWNRTRHATATRIENERASRSERNLPPLRPRMEIDQTFVREAKENLDDLPNYRRRHGFKDDVKRILTSALRDHNARVGTLEIDPPHGRHFERQKDGTCGVRAVNNLVGRQVVDMPIMSTLQTEYNKRTSRRPSSGLSDVPLFAAADVYALPEYDTGRPYTSEDLDRYKTPFHRDRWLLTGSYYDDILNDTGDGHAVSIVDGWLYDSNMERPAPLIYDFSQYGNLLSAVGQSAPYVPAVALRFKRPDGELRDNHDIADVRAWQQHDPKHVRSLIRRWDKNLRGSGAIYHGGLV